MTDDPNEPGRTGEPASPSPARIRVAALIVEDARVLAVEHLKDGASYYLLPGGGADAGETLPAALEREMAEELALEATVGDLALVTESIAPDRGRHLLQIVFRAARRNQPRVTGDDARIRAFRWLSAADLDEVEFRPPIAGWIREQLGARAPAAHYLRLPWT